MKKIFVSTLFLVSSFSISMAQDFGLSFSYFLPRHGDFSTPISPFSIRGLGFDLNRFIALETGASLYRMTGMNLKDLPLESTKPMLGPNFTILIPAELVIQLRGRLVEFDIKGGGFFFYGFAQKMNYGNFDRAIRQNSGFEVANADVTFKNHPGFGYHGGAELTVFVNSQLGISLESNYFVGHAKFPLEGSFVASEPGGTPITEAINYPDTKVDFTGLEFSIGIIMTGGGGAAPKKKPKRRR